MRLLDTNVRMEKARIFQRFVRLVGKLGQAQRTAKAFSVTSAQYDDSVRSSTGKWRRLSHLV